MSVIQDRLKEIEEELDFLDRDERFEWLVDRGKGKKDDVEFLDSEIVQGCQSKVWMRISVEDNKLKILGTSDALIVKGIVSLLIEVFDGISPSDAKSFDFLEWMSAHGLGLSFQRMKGLESMLARIKSATS